MVFSKHSDVKQWFNCAHFGVYFTSSFVYKVRTIHFLQTYLRIVFINFDARQHALLLLRAFLYSYIKNVGDVVKGQRTMVSISKSTSLVQYLPSFYRTWLLPFVFVTRQP